MTRLTYRILFCVLTVVCMLAGSLLRPTAARAHKVSLFAWVENDTVYTLSKFSGGKKVIQGRLMVFDPAGNKLLEGVTDDRGEFAFKIPQKDTELRLKLIAGTGHRAHWRVPLAEISGGFAKSTPTAAGPPGKIPAATHLGDNMTADRLEAAIEKVLDRKLKPVMQMLAKANQPGPSLTEILGGIGYIIGLVGIAAYFKSRQKQ